jgi:hypothetical protein
MEVSMTDVSQEEKGKVMERSIPELLAFFE